MARGSKKNGENLQYFDCKLTLPKKGEPCNAATLGFTMKTRVETDDKGFPRRDRELQPVERWDAQERKIKTSVSAIPTLRSQKWDFVGNETYLSGICVKIQTGAYDYDGDTIPTFKILLKDTKDKDWSNISLPFISIGYESKLTPLQLLTFYNAVANNGKSNIPISLDIVSRDE